MAEEVQTPPATAGGAAGEGGGAEETITIPKTKWEASQSEGIRLAKELDDFKKNNPPKTQTPATELPEKTKFKENMTEFQKEQIAEEKKAQEELKSQLDKLHTVHGEFDDKKLLTFIERYGVYDSAGNVQWERAIELYERLGGNPEYTPKKPAGQRTKDAPVEVDLGKDVGKRTMHDIVQQGLKKFGVGGK